MALDRDLIGAVIAERWEVVEHLGAGAMGMVYRARHIQLKIDVAIKVLKKTAGLTASDIARFYRESQLIASLDHDHIVRVQDTGKTANDDLFFVMEYLRGPNLRTLLHREGPLSWARTRTILLQVCDALSAIHGSGMVHRDLKPHNIVLDPRRNHPDFVKLLDFGVAKPLGEDRQHLTQTGFIVGTLPYMSPEYLLGHPVNVRIDIYALGTIAFELVTGRLPTTNPATNEAMLRSHGVPAAAQVVIARAMARDLEQRYEDADTLAAALSATPADAGTEPEESTTTRFTASPGKGLLAADRLTVSVPDGDSQAITNANPEPLPLTPTVRRQPSLRLADKLLPPPDRSDPARTTVHEAISASSTDHLPPPTTPVARLAPSHAEPRPKDVASEPTAPASAPTELAATRPTIASPSPISPHSPHRSAPSPSPPSPVSATPASRLGTLAPTTTRDPVPSPAAAKPRPPEVPPTLSQSAESSRREAVIDPAQTTSDRTPARFSRAPVRWATYAGLAVAAGALFYSLGKGPPDEPTPPPVSAPKTETPAPPPPHEVPPVPPEPASDPTPEEAFHDRRRARSKRHHRPRRIARLRRPRRSHRVPARGRPHRPARAREAEEYEVTLSRLCSLQEAETGDYEGSV
ncbi:protein kinase domain-containing protein [Nannocystis pusilla]|uniref:serine/threonine-protein kinase n=1 Tax=Nannocystis pusilla TaxID=889268 RepID=UPI003DA41ECB